MRPIYLDNNATTKPSKSALEFVVKDVIEKYGNPSSSHQLGEAAREVIDLSRASIAESIGCAPAELIFTSGGSEANSLALLWRPEPDPEWNDSVIEDRHFVICPNTEHSSTFNCTDAWGHTGSKPDGTVDLEQLENNLARLTKWVRYLTVAVSLVNNETGVIQPVKEIVQLCRKYNARLHIDAVAAYGKMLFNVAELDCDTLSISAHKVHGLKGIGALYVREGTKLAPVLRGGPHERGLRPGTENFIGIAHWVQVITQWAFEDEDFNEKIVEITRLRDYFESLLADVAQINGAGSPRVCNTSNLWFAAVKDLDLFLMKLSDAGLMVSGKAACSSGMPAPSRVLEAMYGKGCEQAKGSIRVSLSQYTSQYEIEKAAEIIRETLGQI